MALTIITKNNATAGVAPSAGQLVQGELAVNVTDKKIYTLNALNQVVLLTSGSAFDIPVVIDVSSSSAALRVTQRGAGDALLIEDSTNPDSSPFVVDASGNVGIGTTTPSNLLSVAGNANITGNTTLGDASTDTVTVNGYIGVGGAPSAARSVYVQSTALTGTTQIGVDSRPVFSSAATSTGYAIISSPATAAASFTQGTLYGIGVFDATKGAGSTITNQFGIRIFDQTQGNTNYGLFADVSSGANKWNIYASGTADNYFAGNVGIGTSSPARPLVVYSASVVPTIQVANATSGVGTNDGLALQLLANDAYIINREAGFLSFSTSNTERMRIDSSGNINIATTGVAAKLYVSGNAAQNIATLTDAATIAVDMGTANNFSVTLGGNRTLGNPTNLLPGQSGVIFITQDGTGGKTLAYSSFWDFSNGVAPTLTTTANAVDALVYTVRTSTTIVASLISNVG